MEPWLTLDHFRFNLKQMMFEQVQRLQNEWLLSTPKYEYLNEEDKL